MNILDFLTVLTEITLSLSLFFFYWSITALQCRLISAAQQSEAIRHIHTSPSSWTSLPALSHTTRSSHSTEPSSVLYSRFPVAIYFTHGSVFMSNLISQFIPLSPPPLCPHVRSLCLPFYSCPANRFICTIFLDSTYMR